MIERARQGYVLSDDPQRLDRDAIRGFLTALGWPAPVSADLVGRLIAGSRCYAVYEDVSGAQVGFARLITDGVMLGYVADVFVAPAHRRRGLASWMVQDMRACPEHQGLRRWLLSTVDAHDLYRGLGFAPLRYPERMMEIYAPDASGAISQAAPASGKPASA